MANTILSRAEKATYVLMEARDNCYELLVQCRPDPEWGEPDEICWEEELSGMLKESGFPHDLETNEPCKNEEAALRCIEAKQELLIQIELIFDHCRFLDDDFRNIRNELVDCQSVLEMRRDAAIKIQKIMRGFKPRQNFLAHLKYKPDGVGYLEAKKSWEEIIGNEAIQCRFPINPPKKFKMTEPPILISGDIVEFTTGKGLRKRIPQIIAQK